MAGLGSMLGSSLPPYRDVGFLRLTNQNVLSNTIRCLFGNNVPRE